jgi:hypothetical protein
MSELCTHLDEVELRELPASVDDCEECLRDGGKWLHLRSWCYLDQVAFVLDGLRGTTRIPPSPLLS